MSEFVFCDIDFDLHLHKSLEDPADQREVLRKYKAFHAERTRLHRSATSF